MSGVNRDIGEAGASHGSAPHAAPYRLVLGFERVGLIALKTPIFSAIVAAALCLVAAFGVGKLKVDDLLSTLFRSNSAEFRHFEEFSKRFPSNEYDVLMVIEGSSLLGRDSIEKLRDLVTDLQLIEGTRGVLSLFSARQPPENGQLPGPLFPADLPEGAGIRCADPESAQPTRSSGASCSRRMASSRLWSSRSIRQWRTAKATRRLSPPSGRRPLRIWREPGSRSS